MNNKSIDTKRYINKYLDKKPTAENKPTKKQSKIDQTSSKKQQIV